MHFLEKKYRKTDGDLINLHLCTKNLDDMIYSSWDIEGDRLKFEILGHFLPFYPPPSKFWKDEKNCWRCHHFTRVPKITIIWYGSWDAEWDRQSILSFGAILCSFTHQSSLRKPTVCRIKILRKWKKQSDILLVYTSVP